MLRALVIAAVVATPLVAACTFTRPLDYLSAEEGRVASDGGVVDGMVDGVAPAEASQNDAATAPFCEGTNRQATFCADFDQGDARIIAFLDGRRTTIDPDKPPGDLTLDVSQAYSKPASLHARVPQISGATVDYAWMNGPVEATNVSSVHFEFRMFVEKRADAPSGIDVATLVFERGDGGPPVRLYYVLRPNADRLALEVGSALDDDFAPQSVVDGQWNHVAIDVTLGAQATATLVVNGTKQAEVTRGAELTTASVAYFIVGFEMEGPTTTTASAFFDDVLFVVNK